VSLSACSLFPVRRLASWTRHESTAGWRLSHAFQGLGWLLTRSITNVDLQHHVQVWLRLSVSRGAFANSSLGYSRPSSLIVTDQYVSSPALHLPPPPPRLGEGPRPSGLRRDNVGRLPSLTTNLPPHSAHPSLLTPLSTSSLSSPFTQSQPAAHSASAVMGTRGVSPMALRASYNVPYNPSEWASGSRRASQSEGQSRPELDGS
jgi:hypothetical protein